VNGAWGVGLGYTGSVVTPSLHGLALLHAREAKALTSVMTSRAAAAPYKTSANLKLRKAVFIWAALPLPCIVVLAVLGQLLEDHQRVFEGIATFLGVGMFVGWGGIVVSVMRQWGTVLTAAPPALPAASPFHATCGACSEDYDIPLGAGAVRCPRCGVELAGAALAAAWSAAAARVRAADEALGAAERVTASSYISLASGFGALGGMAGVMRAARRRAVGTAMEALARSSMAALTLDDPRRVLDWLGRCWQGSVPAQPWSFVTKSWTIERTFRGSAALIVVQDSAAVRGVPARASIEIYLAESSGSVDPELPAELPGVHGYRMRLSDDGAYCVSDDDEPAMLATAVIDAVLSQAHAALASRGGDVAGAGKIRLA